MKIKIIVAFSAIITFLLAFFLIGFQEHDLTPSKDGSKVEVGREISKNTFSDFISQISTSNFTYNPSLKSSEFYTSIVSGINERDSFRLSKYCESSKDSQRCFSEVGANIFNSHPSEFRDYFDICESFKSKENVAFSNRTPDKFCGSGIFYSLFNYLFTDEKASLVRDADIFSFCDAIISDSLAFPCIQEGGKFLTNRGGLEKLDDNYDLCSNLNSVLRVDQCKTGVGRGINLKASGLLTFELQSCLKLKDIYNIKKCLLTIGMDRGSITERQFINLCIGLGTDDVNCYQYYGLFLNGKSHGEMIPAIKVCHETESILGFNNCITGVLDGYIYNNKLYEWPSDNYGKIYTCNLNRLDIFDKIRSLCYTPLLTYISTSDITDSGDSLLKYCESLLDGKFCFMSVGGRLKELGVANRNCDANKFCSLGYIDNNIVFKSKFFISDKVTSSSMFISSSGIGPNYAKSPEEAISSFKVLLEAGVKGGDKLAKGGKPELLDYLNSLGAKVEFALKNIDGVEKDGKITVFAESGKIKCSAEISFSDGTSKYLNVICR